MFKKLSSNSINVLGGWGDNWIRLYLIKRKSLQEFSRTFGCFVWLNQMILSELRTSSGVSKYVSERLLITISVDATKTESIGRYVNDSPHPNAKMRCIYHNKEPRLLLFAITNIPENFEIRYDYQATGLWWRKYKKYKKPFHLKVSF